MVQVVASSIDHLVGSTGGLSQAQEVWQELQPSLDRVDRLEELVARQGAPCNPPVCYI